MNDSKKMSRRDWFRLRSSRESSPRENKTLGAGADPNCKALPAASLPAEGLKPIEHPPNHDGMDVSVLPPMRESVLSSDQVAALFSDVGELGAEVMLMQRYSASSRAGGSHATTPGQLNAAQESLLTGQIQRLQIRYRWQNALWIDTLEASPDGFRLVRIEHQSL